MVGPILLDDWPRSFLPRLFGAFLEILTNQVAASDFQHDHLESTPALLSCFADLYTTDMFVSAADPCDQ